MKTSSLVACMVVLAGVVLVSRADDRKGGDRRVHKLMERTHEGRRSPYGQLRQMVEGANAQWPALEAAVQGFDPMCRALLESPQEEIKGSADGYVEAIKDIAAAVKQKNAQGVTEGFRSLKESCGDCHFKGGVGGSLDHEEEDEDEKEKEDEPEEDEGNRSGRRRGRQ